MSVERDGYAIIPGVLDSATAQALRRAFAEEAYGVRNILDKP